MIFNDRVDTQGCAPSSPVAPHTRTSPHFPATRSSREHDHTGASPDHPALTYLPPGPHSARGSTPGATYKTSKGVSIQADYVFQSIGLQPNTGFYDPAKLNNARRIVVDQFLQVRGAKGHFAVGDCAATEDATYGARDPVLLSVGVALFPCQAVSLRR